MAFFEFAWITDPETWIALATLVALEVVLGIDNLLFIAILGDRVAPERRKAARRAGLAMALVTRLILLAALAWIVGLTQPAFAAFGTVFAWRDLILLGGGLFLLYKGTHEIHNEVAGAGLRSKGVKARASFASVVAQIAVIDIVFSLDSVITAVGMVDELWVMVVAVIAAMILMIVAADPLSRFIGAHPTVKMLALSFLLMIGMVLIADGLGFHIPKGYVYFALAFSVMVEALNGWVRRRASRP